MDHLTEFPSLHLPNAHVNFRVPGICWKKGLEQVVKDFFVIFFVYLMDKFKDFFFGLLHCFKITIKVHQKLKQSFVQLAL